METIATRQNQNLVFPTAICVKIDEKPFSEYSLLDQSAEIASLRLPATFSR